MIALRVVAGVTNHFMMRLPEWTGAVILFNFGTTMLQVPETHIPIFSVLEHYADQHSWGVILTVLAGARIGALVLNGTFYQLSKWSVRVRAISATLCCFAWFSLSLGLYLSDSSITGWKTYLALLASDMIMAVHLGGQAGKADRSAWNGSA